MVIEKLYFGKLYFFFSIDFNKKKLTLSNNHRGGFYLRVERSLIRHFQDASNQFVGYVQRTREFVGRFICLLAPEALYKIRRGKLRRRGWRRRRKRRWSEAWLWMVSVSNQTSRPRLPKTILISRQLVEWINIPFVTVIEISMLRFLTIVRKNTHRFNKLAFQLSTRLHITSWTAFY